MALRFRHAVGWTLAGNGVNVLAQWLILVAIGRLGGVAELGTFALALAIASPVAMLCGLEMRNLFVADVCRGASFQSFVMLHNGLFVSAIVLLGVTAFLWKGDPAFVALLILVMSSKMLLGLSNLVQASLQRRERLDLANQIFAVTSVVSALAFIAAFAASKDLVVGAAAQAGTQLFMLILLQVTGLRRIAPTLMWFRSYPPALVPDIRAIVWSGLPLGLSSLGIALIGNVPRYAIEAYFGAVELGLFAACAYFVSAGNRLIFAVNQALLRRTAVAFQDGDGRSYARFLGLGFLAGLTLGVLALAGALIAGETLLTTIYGDAFAAGQGMLIWVLVFGALSWVTAPLRTALTIQKQLWAQPMINTVTVVLVAAASIVLVREMGPEGAGAALVVGGLARFLACGLLVLGSTRARACLPPPIAPATSASAASSAQP